MARRTSQAAQLAGFLEGVARVRFLLRNPDFQQDLFEAQKRWPQDKGLDCLDLLPKWGLAWLPLEVLDHPLNGGLWDTSIIKHHEQIIAKALTEHLGSQGIEDAFMVKPPVTAWDYCEDYVRHHWDGEVTLEIPAQVPHAVDLTVDQSFPKDVQNEYVRLARLKAGRRREFKAQSISAPTEGRRRLEEVASQLQVYDLHLEGKSFDQIAHLLKQPKSTVQSAWEAAKRHIGGLVLDFQGRSRIIAVSRIKPGSFNLGEHMALCEECRLPMGAPLNREWKFCPTVEAYVNQEVSWDDEAISVIDTQSEDWERVEAIALRQKLYPAPSNDDDNDDDEEADHSYLGRQESNSQKTRRSFLIKKRQTPQA